MNEIGRVYISRVIDVFTINRVRAVARRDRYTYTDDLTATLYFLVAFGDLGMASRALRGRRKGLPRRGSPD